MKKLNLFSLLFITFVLNAFGQAPKTCIDSLLTNPEYLNRLPLIEQMRSEGYTDRKIFDYLEAGLNVLISDELFQLWILKRHGAAIEIDNTDAINDIIRKLTIFEPSIKNSKIICNYNHLTLKTQGPRLLNFYEKILSEC